MNGDDCDEGLMAPCKNDRYGIHGVELRNPKAMTAPWA